jgi:DNA-directed RNA polymerase specialized sigma24 family protein
MSKKYRDEAWLREKYVEEWLSTREIAAECGCCKTTVRNWLKKFGIDRDGCEKQASDKRLTDKEWLQQQHIEQGHSAVQIAAECGCSETTVHRWFNRHDIDSKGLERLAADERLKDADWLRKKFVEQRMPTGEIAEMCGCNRSTVQRWARKHGLERRTLHIGQDKRLSDADWMRTQYVEQQQSMPKIASECGCSVGAVHGWLVHHNIERRQWRAELEGEDHPLWNGGTMPYGRGWNQSKKQAVRERDSHTCQDPNCSVTQDEHLAKHGQKLHVHHLQKARDIDDPQERNAKENLITLCLRCHRRWEKVADAGLVPEVCR